MVWSISLSIFFTVNVIRLHPDSVLVTMYHWYLPYFVLISINLELYGLIAEKYVFALTDTGQVTVALETAVMMKPVREVTRAARIVRSMTAVMFASLLLSLMLSCLLLVQVTLIPSDF